MTSMAYLGLVYLEKGDTQKAIKMLEKARGLSELAARGTRAARLRVRSR